MGMIRTPTRITGFDAVGAALTIIGDAVGELHFPVGSFLIEQDTTTVPPRVKITLAEVVTAGLEEVTDTVNTLVTSTIPALDTRVNNLEAERDRVWDVPATFVCSTGSDTLTPNIGEWRRLNVEIFGNGDTLTVTLPLATSSMVGRRIGLSEITGVLLNGLGGQILVTTTSGQSIDALTLPHDVTGSRVKFVVIACEVSTGVYGWTVESQEG